MHLALTLCQV